MKIGIIGAENSHTVAIAKVLNIEKKVKGCSVACVWGETEELATRAAADGSIPAIVKRPVDMLGEVDAVVVDHRHPKHHLKAVWRFMEHGTPMFVDKPFCHRSEEGRRFLDQAREHGAPVTSFSAVPHYDSFLKFMAKLPGLGALVSGHTWGPCDLKSPYGGVFFYGIHQVEVALAAFGYDVAGVRMTKNGPHASCQLLYPSGVIVTMSLIKEGCKGFGVGAVGANGALQMDLDSGKSPYLRGVKIFTEMFSTRQEPLTHAQLLKPVLVLEAMERAIKTGNVEKVGD